MKIFALAFLFGSVAYAQSAVTACSTTTPCAQITITVANAAATVTTGVNSSGQTVELSGPVTLDLRQCIGSSTGCGTVSVPGSNGWVSVSSVLTMTSPTLVYNVPETLGTLANFSASATFTGSLGGVASPFSAPFQIPIALQTTQTAPQVPAINTITIVTSGNTGVQ